jgi:hypothetical protein
MSGFVSHNKKSKQNVDLNPMHANTAAGRVGRVVIVFTNIFLPNWAKTAERCQCGGCVLYKKGEKQCRKQVREKQKQNDRGEISTRD